MGWGRPQAAGSKCSWKGAVGGAFGALLTTPPLLKRLGWVGWGTWCSGIQRGRPRPRPSSLLLVPHSQTPGLWRRRPHPHRAALGWGLTPHTCGLPWRGRALPPAVEVRPPGLLHELFPAYLLPSSKMHLNWLKFKSRLGQRMQTRSECNIIYKGLGQVFIAWVKGRRDHKTRRCWHPHVLLKV